MSVLSKSYIHPITKRVVNPIFLRQDYLEKKPSIVYKITNKLNGCSYIGMTTRSLQQRWYEHCKSAFRDNSDNIFHKAIREFGKEKFKLEILERYDCEFFCKAGELFWINKLKTFYFQYPYTGYNMTRGGEDLRINHERLSKGYRKESKTIIQLDFDYNVIATYKSLRLAFLATKIKNIGRCCVLKSKSAGGFYWRYLENQYEKYEEKLGRKQKIKQYELNGNFIQEFDSLFSAERQTKISYSKISNCCTGKCKSAGGFQWKYINDNSECKKHDHYSKIKRKVTQYDVNHNLIKEFDSIKEAKLETSDSYIYECITQPRLSEHGFIWKYTNDINLPIKKKVKFHKRKVSQYDLSGLLIATYDTIKEASLTTNINPSMIGRCCKGKIKKAGDFTWRYIDTIEDLNALFDVQS